MVWDADIINDNRCGQKRCDWYINGDIIEFLDYMYDNKLKYNKLILKQY